jgi:hypothetical protein
MKENTYNQISIFEAINVQVEQLDLKDGEDILVHIPQEYLRVPNFSESLIQNFELFKKQTGKDFRFWLLPAEVKVEKMELTDNHDVLMYVPNEYLSKEGYMEQLGTLAEQIKQRSGKDFGFWIVPDTYKVESHLKGILKKEAEENN